MYKKKWLFSSLDFIKGKRPNEPHVQELVDIITNIVDPVKRDGLKFNLKHEIVLNGTKRKKELSRKQKKIKCKTLSRKQNAEIGLYTLPTKSLKYDDLMPLHRLWSGYITQHLSLSPDTVAIANYDPGYDNFSKLLIKSDFHGAIVTVIRSKCPGHVGASGIVAMDTKNTFKIVSADNRLRSNFSFFLILKKINLISFIFRCSNS